MTFVYIVLAIGLLVLTFNLINKILMKKKCQEIMNKLTEKGYKLTLLKKHAFDYTLTDDNKILYFKILPIPTNSSVTINSKFTWRLTWGGSSQNKGRAYPNNRYMDEVVKAIKMPITADKTVIKVFVLYQETEHIYKYRNESEIDEITTKDTPYGYKVIRFSKLEDEFDDLLVLKA